MRARPGAMVFPACRRAVAVVTASASPKEGEAAPDPDA